MPLSAAVLQGLIPNSISDYAAEDAKRQMEQSLNASKLQAMRLDVQGAREEQANKRRAMAVSMLGGIENEADPEQRAQLYATLKPLAERYDTTLRLPDSYDPGLTRALFYSQISPKHQLELQSQREKAQMMSDYRSTVMDQKEEIARQRAEQQRQQKTDQQARQYSEAIDKNGLTDLASAVNNAVDKLTTYSQPGADIPGFGQVAGMLPDWAVSGGGKDIRQAYASVRNSVLKARSGGAVTDGEAARLLQELGEGTGLPDSQVIKGMTNVSEFLQNRIGQLQAGYDPEAISKYRERGGNVTKDAVKGFGSKKGPSRIIDFNDLPE